MGSHELCCNCGCFPEEGNVSPHLVLTVPSKDSSVPFPMTWLLMLLDEANEPLITKWPSFLGLHTVLELRALHVGVWFLLPGTWHQGRAVRDFYTAGITVLIPK